MIVGTMVFCLDRGAEIVGAEVSYILNDDMHPGELIQYSYKLIYECSYPMITKYGKSASQ